MRKGNLLLVLLTFANLANGQPYGEILYSHNAGSKLSSGALMTQSVGVLLAGHLDSCAVNGKNFWIDRTDAGGDINGSTWEFQRAYQISGHYCACTGGSGSIYRCGTVKAIETTNSLNPYAVAGGIPHGFFFSLLNPNGTPAVAVQYSCPGAPHNPIREVQIIESQANPGEYFVCAGSANGEMYIERIDGSGTSIASYAFSNSSGDDLVPYAMLESPYTNDITIVGLVSSVSGAWDGFFFQIDQTLTTISNFFYYDDGGDYEGFHSINIANSSSPGSTGFIIGGTTRDQAAGSLAKPLFLKVDQNGGVIWNTIITGSYDSHAGPVQGIFERLNSANPAKYEYYGTSTSTVGIVVYKLDDSGQPWHNTYATTPDEYLYNSSGSAIASTRMMTHNGVGSNDVGIQLYGNDEGC